MVLKKNEGVQYNFLNDRPTSRDEIGTHSKIAESLLKIIHSNLERPFVVGLFGPWGVGKSSIAKMLQEITEEAKNNTKVVIVDAWRKHKETFLRQFVKQLARALVSNESKRADIIKELDFKRARHDTSWEPHKKARGAFWGCMVALVIGATILTAVSYYIENFPTTIWIPIVTGVVLSTYYHFFLPKYSKHVTDYTEDVTLHDVTHFRKVYFEDVIVQSDYRTICIVIDNLDRVRTDEALAIMRMIKTFIVDARQYEGDCTVSAKDYGKVVFIIPCDDGALREYVVKRSSEESGNEFLRKFFNVSLRIPSFNDRDCYRYACNLLDQTHLELDQTQTDKIADVIKSLFGKNPRQPKIFINNFLARYIVGESFEKSNKLVKGMVTEHPEWFAVYVALDTEFSDLEMPKTADRLRVLLKGDNQSRNGREQFRKKSRVEFLQKVRFTVKSITPYAWAAYYYLKKANVVLLIDGFEELEDAALKGTNDFVDKLDLIRAEHPNVVQLLWNGASGGETQVKFMQSILKAKAKNPQLSLEGRVPEEMAGLIERRIRDLPMLPADVVYQEILRPREEALYGILYDIVATDNSGSKAELYRDGGPKEFQVELVREMLRGDEDFTDRIVERLCKAVDFLGARTDELTIPAIKNGKYRSANIIGKGIKLFREGRESLCPSKLVDYCGNFEGNQCIEYLKQIVDGLNQNLTANKYKTKELCETANKVKALIKMGDGEGVNIGQVNVIKTIMGLDSSYEQDNDWTGRYAILTTVKEYYKLDQFPGWRENAKNVLINRGNHFLKSGEDNIVSEFLENEQEMVGIDFAGVLPVTAARAERLCHVVLDCYPESYQPVIAGVFPSQPGWVVSWVESRGPRLDEKARGNIQSGLLEVAPQTNYRIEIYKALSFLDVSQSENAVRTLENHFSTLITSKQPLTIAENLAFMLERIVTAKYLINEEQRNKLKDAFEKIDQDIVSSELKKLIRDYKKLKKRK